MKAVAMLKLVIIAVLFISSCASKEVSPIGVWGNAQVPESVEFKADTTGLFAVKGQQPLLFTWRTIDKNRFRIDVSFNGAVRTLLGQIVDDSIVLEGSGQKATYKRLK